MTNIATEQDIENIMSEIDLNYEGEIDTLSNLPHQQDRIKQGKEAIPLGQKEKDPSVIATMIAMKTLERRSLGGDVPITAISNPVLKTEKGSAVSRAVGFIQPPSLFSTEDDLEKLRNVFSSARANAEKGKADIEIEASLGNYRTDLKNNRQFIPGLASNEDFVRCKNNLVNIFTNEDSPESGNVSFSKTRVEIQRAERGDIRKITDLQNPDIPPIYQVKTRDWRNALDNEIWGVRVNTSTELVVSSEKYRSDQAPKTIRDRNRWTIDVIAGAYSGIQIALSVITDNSVGNKSRVSYEVEIEVTDILLVSPETFVAAIRLVYGSAQVLPDTNNPVISLAEKNAVIRYHNDLFGVNKMKKEMVNALNNPPTLYKNYENKPTNVTLEDLTLPSSEYSVTVKVDGTRKFILVTDFGIYFISNNSILKVASGNRQLMGTYIDGEYYHENGLAVPLRDADNNIILEDDGTPIIAKIVDVNKYYAFDILFYKGKDVRENVFPERIKLLHQITLNLDPILYVNKPFWGPFGNVSGGNNIQNFYEAVRSAFEYSNDYEKNVATYDGIIMQPSGPYKNDLTRKWKELSKLTIDFELMESETPNVFLLFSGDRIKGKYQLIEFKGTNDFPVIGQITIEDGTVLEDGTVFNSATFVDGSVMEVAYDFTNSRFVPYRIRSDKPFPNALEVAKNVWSDIANPDKRVSRETILGENARIVRKYHNAVKQEILRLNCKPGNNILDIGSGRGGDLGKWKNLNLNNIYCIEPNRENYEELVRRLEKMYADHVKRTVNRENKVDKEALKVMTRLEADLNKANAKIVEAEKYLGEHVEWSEVINKPEDYDPQMEYAKWSEIADDLRKRLMVVIKEYQVRQSSYIQFPLSGVSVIRYESKQERNLSDQIDAISTELNQLIISDRIGDEETVLEDTVDKEKIASLSEQLRKLQVARESLDLRLAKVQDTIKVCSFIGDDRIALVVAFFSLTFVYESADIFHSFIDTIAGVMKEGTLFVGIVMDGDKTMEFVRSGNGESNENSAVAIKLLFDKDQENDTFGKKISVRIKDEGSMVDYEEYLADFSILQETLAEHDIVLHKTFFLDSGDKYNILPRDSQVYSAMNRAFLFEKVKPKTPRDTGIYIDSSIPLSTKWNFDLEAIGVIPSVATVQYRENMTKEESKPEYEKEYQSMIANSRFTDQLLGVLIPEYRDQTSLATKEIMYRDFINNDLSNLSFDDFVNKDVKYIDPTDNKRKKTPLFDFVKRFANINDEEEAFKYLKARLNVAVLTNAPFLHAVDRALTLDGYMVPSSLMREEFVIRQRFDIAEGMTMSIFKSLQGGFLAQYMRRNVIEGFKKNRVIDAEFGKTTYELAVADPEYSWNVAYQTFLEKLTDKKVWIGADILLEIISMTYNINIFIMDKYGNLNKKWRFLFNRIAGVRPNEEEIAPEETEIDLTDERESIILMTNDSINYRTIGVKADGKLNTVLPRGHSFAKLLFQEMNI